MWYNKALDKRTLQTITELDNLSSAKIICNPVFLSLVLRDLFLLFSICLVQHRIRAIVYKMGKKVHLKNRK